MSLVICELNTITNLSKKVLKTSSSGLRTLPDGMTGAHSNRCTNYLYLYMCMSLTFCERKSKTRLLIKLLQTPELAYDYFRTVINATSSSMTTTMN